MFPFSPPNIDALKKKGNVQGLIRALNYKKDPAVRQVAAKVLGEIGDSIAVEPLIEIAIGNDSKELRITAVDSLGMLGDERAVEPLLMLRSSSDSFVYANVEKSIRSIGDPAVDLLIGALSHTERRVRDQAARMLIAFSWEPGNTIEKASLWIARREFDRLRELDYHTIKPLLIQSVRWENHPEDFYLNLAFARFILNTEKNLDDPIVSLAHRLLEVSIREYPKTLDKMSANPWAYEDYPEYVSEIDKRKFGDYADLVRSVVSYKRVITHSWDVYNDYEYKTDRSVSAIERLCGISTPVSTNLLHHFTKLKDGLADSTNRHPTFGNIPTTKVSFEIPRSIAISELARRGSPEYDLSIYKSEDCWRIQ
ncbi:MAG: HEAT repeat domain-containing protein [Anaerolineae bacterium]|nr:HEAT repeat domain-containing protein [Anaerolineae bacterium]